MDLAASSITEARSSPQPHLRFLQHDMRMPFGRDAFDYIFNFFTSFGYFQDAAEHQAVVRNMAAALKSGGVLVLDYLNVRDAECRLRSEEVKDFDGVIYRLTRWTDARYFFKRIVIEDGVEGRLEYTEQVARFTLGDFARMFAAHHLSIEAVYGDYRLNAYDAGTSPRLILIARKPGRSERRSLARQVLADAADGLRRDAEV
jgi:SAM-dependent methyltransferase